MKIGFDGTVLHGRKSGVGYYCEELFKAMVTADHRTQFFLFSHQPVNLTLPAANGNVSFADSFFCRVRAIYLHGLLPQLLRREKPDLCHYTNFLAPVADSTPYVVTVHDMGLERLHSAHPLAKRIYTRRLIPRIAERARFVITNSEFSKWEIVRYLGIPTDRIRVTPLAASPDFHPISRGDREATLRKYHVGPAYLLYVGNLEPRKNLVRLLEAFSTLKDQDHELVIVGNSWYRAGDAVEAARRFGVAGRTRFLGYVPRGDLPSLYSGATAFVYPSLLEGFGLPVMEAMACGAPVVTSDNSSLKEIAGGAALLVHPVSAGSICDGLTAVVSDHRLRTDLASRGLKRAGQFSWEITAALTLDVYREAAEDRGRRFYAVARPGEVDSSEGSLSNAILRTLEYAALFQYPLRLDELHERLFDAKADLKSVQRACSRLGLRPVGDFIATDPDFVSIRHFRETISDRAIEEVWPHLRILASMPFIRMIAFSGATAHRNMNSGEDVDLFMVVEDGKLWGTFLIAMTWAKVKGLRQRLCMNYVVTDRALPLFDHDAFTAQQAASLKPVFGKSMYEAFIAANPMVKTHFPNFNSHIHRSMYPEIQVSSFKRIVEMVLRCGPIQTVDRLSRWLLGVHLRRKAASAAGEGDMDVVLDRRRLKLHMKSHKQAVLSQPLATPKEFVR
jgi:glycosyltransferase involved in cell wall biosynthesis